MRTTALHLRSTLALYWELASLFFSILAVGVAVLLFFDHAPSTMALLLIADACACFLFATEFFVGLARASDRKKYLRQHWPDLLASIPVAEQFRWFRLLRILRIRHLFHANYRRRLKRIWVEQAAESAIFLILTSVLPLTFLAIYLILEIEDEVPEANIRTLGDAAWWFWATITTVGYGDYYPVTAPGRSLAALVMLVGIGTFSSLTALLSSRLTERWNQGHSSQIDDEIVALREQVDRLERLLREQETKHSSGAG